MKFAIPQFFDIFGHTFHGNPNQGLTGKVSNTNASSLAITMLCNLKVKI